MYHVNSILNFTRNEELCKISQIARRENWENYELREVKAS